MAADLGHIGPPDGTPADPFDVLGRAFVMFTFTKFRETAVAGLALCTLSCATGMSGKVSGGQYVSPQDNFSLPIPSMMFGTRMEDRSNDDGGVVSFHSDMGSLRRIEYSRVPSEASAAFADSTTRDEAYRNFFHTAVVPSLQAILPGTEVLHAEFVGEGPEQAYFAVVRMPEGSPVMDAKTQKRFDSIQRILVFSHGSFMYVLSAEPRMTFGGEKESDESREWSPEIVMAFRRTIEFR
jgi:hypothetical protein